MDHQIKTISILFATTLLFVLLVQTEISAQDKLLRRISVKEGGYYHLLYVDYTNEEIKVDNQLNYYWFDNGKIFTNRGGFSGQLLQGIYKKTAYTGRLVESGNYTNGLKDGVWKKWDSEGNFIEIVNWKQGLKNGNSTVFRNDSNERTVSQFKNGILNGWVTEYKNDTITNQIKYKRGEIINNKGFLFFNKKAKQINEPSISNDLPEETIP